MHITCALLMHYFFIENRDLSDTFLMNNRQARYEQLVADHKRFVAKPADSYTAFVQYKKEFYAHGKSDVRGDVLRALMYYYNKKDLLEEIDAHSSGYPALVEETVSLRRRVNETLQAERDALFREWGIGKDSVNLLNLWMPTYKI